MFRRSIPDASPNPAGEPAPRIRRWGLYGPYIALAIAVTIWTGVWIAARQEVIRRMDGAVARLESAGYSLTWTGRKVGGYPFRLDLVLTGLDAQSPSGWGMASKRFEAEAYLHAPDHWIFATPEGLTLLRPTGGPVEVTGSTLHASLHGMAVRPPSFSFEGLNLQFSPQAGAATFALASADKIELHVRPGPDHQGAVLFRVTNGKASLPGLLGKVADGKPVNAEFDAILSKADDLKGPGLARALKSWALSGGQANLRSAKIIAGPAMIKAEPGVLALNPEGRLQGELKVALSKAPESLKDLSDKGLVPAQAAAAAAADPSLEARATLKFHDGLTYLGQIPVCPAPKLF